VGLLDSPPAFLDFRLSTEVLKRKDGKSFGRVYIPSYGWVTDCGWVGDCGGVLMVIPSGNGGQGSALLLVLIKIESG
jgi:hypothetical protein